MTTNQQKSSGVMWLALGLSLGLVLLLNYGHILTWDVWWRLLQTWPVALIAWWVEFAFNRRSNLGSILASVLILVTVMVTVLLTVLIPDPTQAPVALRYPRESVNHLQVTMKQSVGQVYVGPLQDSAQLITATLLPGRNERVTHRYKISGDTATFSLRAKRRFAPAFVSSGDDHQWEVRVQPTVTLSLDASLGEGSYTFDLRQLSVARANLDFAIGKLDLTLPRRGSGDFNIEGTIGNVRIEVPPGKAVRVNTETSLATCRLPSTYVKHNEVYVSPACTPLSACTTISVSLSVGNVLVVELSP